MKRALTIFAVLLLITGIAPANAISKKQNVTYSNCASVLHVKAGKGTMLGCLDGSAGTTFESLRGPVVVNVWGSWCPPCVAEIPHFRALFATGKVRIVGIDVEEKGIDSGQRFSMALNMRYPIFYDPDGRTKGIFGLGVPVTWFIDAKGKVVYRQIGTIKTDKQLFDLVTKYLKVKL